MAMRWSQIHSHAAENLFDLLAFNAPIESFRALLEKGVDNIDARSSDAFGNTALMIACKHQLEEVFDLLIQFGADVNIADHRKNTALHWAAKYFFDEAIPLLAKRVSDVNARNSRGETALHCTVRSDALGFSSEVEWLVKYGADINRRDSVNFTPLMCAAACSRIEEFHILMECDAKIADDDVWLLLYHASRNGWDDEFSFLLKRVPYLQKVLPMNNYQFQFWSAGHLEQIEFLMGLGTDVDGAGKDMMCREALRRASADGHLELVSWLVKRVSDVNDGNHRGETALHLAARAGKLRIVSCLLEAGAHVNRMDEKMETAVFKAIRRLKVVKYLVQKGADIFSRNETGQTVLFVACMDGRLETVKYLVELGVYRSAKTIGGVTPLLMAAQLNHKIVVDFLMSLGASFAGTTPDKSTMLHVVSTHGWIDTVRTVLKRGCEVDAKNVYGYTALCCATKAEKVDVVHALFQAGANWDTIVDDRSLFNSLTNKRWPKFELVKLFIENGAFLKPVDYNALMKSSSSRMFKDVKLCYQALVNKFNNQDLPELYKFPESGILPRIEQMKIVSDTEVARAIEETVEFEVCSKDHCNVLQVRPMPLSVLSVQTALEYYRKRAAELENHLALKRQFLSKRCKTC